MELHNVFLSVEHFLFGHMCIFLVLACAYGAIVKLWKKSVWRQSDSNCEYVYSMFVCMCTCVGMFVYVCACNKVHLAAELSSGAPGVSVAHAPPPFAAAVLLSGDTPAHLNGPPNFLSVTSITLSGLTNPSCDDRMTNHEINFSRCSTSKEINFCDQWVIVSLWHYIINW